MIANRHGAQCPLELADANGYRPDQVRIVVFDFADPAGCRVPTEKLRSYSAHPWAARHLSKAACRGPAIAVASANPEAGTARLMKSRQKRTAAFESTNSGWALIGWGVGAHDVMPRPMIGNVFFIAGARSLLS